MIQDDCDIVVVGDTRIHSPRNLVIGTRRIRCCEKVVNDTGVRGSFNKAIVYCHHLYCLRREPICGGKQKVDCRGAAVDHTLRVGRDGYIDVLSRIAAKTDAICVRGRVAFSDVDAVTLINDDV